MENSFVTQMHEVLVKDCQNCGVYILDTEGFFWCLLRPHLETA